MGSSRSCRKTFSLSATSSATGTASKAVRSGSRLRTSAYSPRGHGKTAAQSPMQLPKPYQARRVGSRRTEAICSNSKIPAVIASPRTPTHDQLHRHRILSSTAHPQRRKTNSIRWTLRRFRPSSTSSSTRSTSSSIKCHKHSSSTNASSAASTTKSTPANMASSCSTTIASALNTRTNCPRHGATSWPVEPSSPTPTSQPRPMTRCCSLAGKAQSARSRYAGGTCSSAAKTRR